MIARVCLIEDDPIMGESLHQRLSLEGFACDWHHTGAAALEAIGRETYAAVVSDVRLPDLSGEALFRTALDRDEHAPPFVFVTAYGSIDRAVELIKLGAADYVTKPFDVEQLILKLRVSGRSAGRNSDCRWAGRTRDIRGSAPGRRATAASFPTRRHRSNHRRIRRRQGARRADPASTWRCRWWRAIYRRELRCGERIAA